MPVGEHGTRIDAMSRPPFLIPPRLPHPQVESAPFVIAPLHDLAPDLVHPVSGETMAALRGTLPTDVPGVELYDEEVVY